MWRTKRNNLWKFDTERERQSWTLAFNYLKRGRYLICQHSKKGWGGREREREEWLGGCVSVWVRDTGREKEEGCRQRERERERELQQSDLSCGEDTQEKCIPEAASRGEGGRDRAEKSRHPLNLSMTTSDCLWPPLDSHAPQSHTSAHSPPRIQTHTHTHIHTSGTTGSAARQKWRISEPGGGNHTSEEKDKILSLGECQGFRGCFECVLVCVNVSVRKFLWSRPIRLSLCCVFQHACRESRYY